MEKQHSKKYIKTSKAKSTQIMDILYDEHKDCKCGLDYETPLQLVVALILAAQCTDERVNKTIPELFAKFENAEKLANANIDDVIQIIRPCGFFKNKAKAILAASKIIFEKYNNIVPNCMDELVKLPGIGRKSANIILQECYNKTVGIAVDTHVTRLSYKIGFTNEQTQENIEKALMKKFPKKYWAKINHILVWHGRKYCIANRPKCDICPISSYCPKNI